jgi:hypothetical protein
MAESFILDNIVAEVTPDQHKTLATLWGRIDILTNGTVPDFHSSSLAALQRRSSDFPIDLAFLSDKPTKSALEKTTPADLLFALRANVKHEDPDTLLVRFLRARSWNIDASFLMLLKSLSWRAEEKIESGLLEGGDAQFDRPEAYSTDQERKIARETKAMTSSGESFVHGADKKGHPLVYIRVKLHDQWAQGKEAFLRSTIMEVESTRMLLRPPVTSVSIVFDLTGFGLRNMVCPHHILSPLSPPRASPLTFHQDMNALKVMASGLQDNYPECLGSVYVFNAPWIINRIWGAIQLWLDPVVAAKVKFLSTLDQLAEYIPREHIPKYMGGQDTWEWKWVPPVQPAPLSAEEKAKVDGAKEERKRLLDEYISVTSGYWKEVLAGETGKVEESQRKRHELALRLRDNYWSLDKYVRGRVWLDRVGILKEDGAVDLTPK